MKGHQNQCPVQKTLGITKNWFIIAWIGLLLGEIIALYRFNQTSKNSNVYGIEQGYFGVYRDNSDPQWNEFSDHIFEILLFQMLFLVGSYSVKYVSNSNNRLKYLQLYNIIAGFCYAFYLHSIGMVFQLTVIVMLYMYQKIFYKFKYFVSILWTFVILVLYLNETYQGFQFQMISDQFIFLDEYKNKNQLIRWNIVFNMILLRIVSFSLDKVWAYRYSQNYQKLAQKQVENNLNFPQPYVKKTYKDIVKEHQPLEEYNFIGYLSFLFYVPLLFSGPSMGFNAFNSQLKIPQTTMSRLQVIKYVLKVYCIDFLTFEIFLHICYPNAIPKLDENRRIVTAVSIWQQHSMAFFNLIFLWYKFLTIWRIARGWALLDGIETPENMNRCIYNNYCFSGFWRSWHRSFNQWLIRYIYVPLGGSKWKVLNMWIVFTFVALWHDFKLDLLLWAWIICLALIPEIAVQKYFDKEYFYQKWWFKYACIFAGAFQIEMMCLANLIGFGSGHEGMGPIIKQFLTLEGALCLLCNIFLRNSFGAVIQFKIREIESQRSSAKNF